MLDTFAQFCQTPDQRLVCSAEGSDNGDELVVRITHRLNPGASAAALLSVRSVLGGAAEELLGFFARFNGATLFVDERSGTAAISIAPVELWDSLTEQYQDLREDLELFGADDEDDEALFESDDPFLDDEFDDDALDLDEDPALQAWMDSAVAFAEITDSGSLFLVATDGEGRGNIYFFDADLGEPELFATCFAEFLARIVYCDPPRLLQYLGDLVSYGDGSTDTQWLPRRYVVGQR